MKKNKKLSPWNRREFFKFIGKSGATGALLGSPFLSSCQSLFHSGPKALLPSYKDQVELIEGLQYQVLIEAGATIGKNMEFGYNNDYIALLPKSSNEAHLWVNHETIVPYLVSERPRTMPPTKKQFQNEKKQLGGSYIKIVRDADKWKVDDSARENFRLDANTKIPFANQKKVMGQRIATGTFANCAGGLTPWGTILTCEENYDLYVGDSVYDEKGRRSLKDDTAYHKWTSQWNPPPEHYGWVVEVNPKTKKAKKLTALGRFAHEGACVVETKGGRLVVYMGDDQYDECLYKFISKRPRSLEDGELFVADFILNQWVSLNRSKSIMLQSRFKSQLDVMIRAREAGKLMGGTPLNRPEDIQRDPLTGNIIVALTNNIPKGDHYGSLLKIEEKNNNPLSLEFKHDTLLAGGKENDFCCPDNLAFAPNGDLWFTVDITDSLIGKGAYEGFGNNSLYHVPRKGPRAGEAIRVANAPIDAEFTGPCFSEDGKTLFLSVQHPGRNSLPNQEYTSHWPHGGKSKPVPAVIAITGEYLS